MSGTLYSLELRPRIPAALQRLEELASNLMYSWDRDIRGVFWRLDRQLWNAVGNNPKVFLRRVPQATLDAAAGDRDFLEDYHRALTSYDSYRSGTRRSDLPQHLDPDQDLVAYFCAEYGLHESFPIYSGGLGILAGDHCKAASDVGVPFVAVGLLYRQGYFTQTIDGHGRQQAQFHAAAFDDLPVTLATDEGGRELRPVVAIGERDVQLRVWRALVGHVTLVLLDADVPDNAEADRGITHRLYGGDSETRIQQEIVLGVGGVRALRLLGHQPSVWHINEGHAAFQILERVREGVAQGLDFDAALEGVAAATVFTTHTPVPAGHDIFSHGQMRHHFLRFLPELKAEPAAVLALGADPHGADRFNMTALALRGSRFHNGVSQIHGEVASRMESYVWLQVPPAENPLRHVTNGVHMNTFIARAWTQLFHDSFRDWRNQLLNTEYWQRVDSIPGHRFVSIRQQLKRDLMIDLLERLRRQHRRNGVAEAIIARATHWIEDIQTRTLVLGFARRFATYKRATLILRDPARLARLLGDPERPAILVFAGKAHPRDLPGQELIRQLHELSMRPEFIGRLLVVEGYDMLLARNLVQGCDVWLNTPEYPLEASGTSGMKAGINGVVNVSVLDGWWAEGHDGSNGYAIAPVGGNYDPAERDQEEARQLLDILEHQVVPTYYGPDHRGYAPAWVQVSKNSMKTLIPRFNASRQVMDYVRGFYGPAARQGRRLAADGSAGARALAAWKQHVRERWGGVRIALAGALPATLTQGERLPLRVHAWLHGLAPGDVTVECILGRLDVHGEFEPEASYDLQPTGVQGDAHEFSLELEPLPGLQHYRVRMYPSHPALSHRFELGCMVWA
ncbi:MAG TPA: alpha-glucan family phosphorylase [Solimonas sp.]|nr:alpha-glucan family phosphorylase [Solimonas sp.]